MENARLSRLAWITLAYTVAVIIFGGIVRATGSGAGCGSHWPLCNGEVLPPEAATETLIEYGHRISSGLAFLLVVAVFLLARRSASQGAPVRRWAAWSLVFMILEALVGAGLVIFEHVAYNVSFARAYWMAAHLINTLLLLCAMTLTAWFASGGGSFSLRGHGRLDIFAWGGVIAMVLIGISGAVAALGDTLVFSGGIDPDSDPIVAALVGLRIYHPLLAISGAAYLMVVIVLVDRLLPSEAVRRLASVVTFLLIAQLVIGIFNVWLAAPVVLQMVHLLVTDLIWIGLVLLAATAFSITETVKPAGV